MKDSRRFVNNCMQVETTDNQLFVRIFFFVKSACDFQLRIIKPKSKKLLSAELKLEMLDGSIKTSFLIAIRDIVKFGGFVYVIQVTFNYFLALIENSFIYISIAW